MDKRSRNHFRNYYMLLFAPWKIVTFFISYSSLLYFGALADDPTWDFGSVTIMSVLTFLSAPWSVAVIYRSVDGRHLSSKTILALLLWLFSVSGSYGLYVFFKSSYRAEAVVENFLISTSIYFLAGLYWSIFQNEDGIKFEFQMTDWPALKPKFSLKGMLLVGLPIMLAFLFILERLVHEI